MLHEPGLQPEPSVTAVIPTRGRPESARRAIVSVLKQTHPSVNVVLVIDGPDERTREMVAELNDPRVQAVELSSNVGAAEARNIGAERANGEWIAFLDDDDEWLPEKISAQLELARKSPARNPVLTCRIVVRTTGYEWVSPVNLYAGQPISEYLFCRTRFIDGTSFIQTSTLMARRELLRKVPFATGLKLHQDWDWLLRVMAEDGAALLMHPDALAVFDIQEGRSSIGRSVNWELSYNWARSMRRYFTGRAYSYFVASECLKRARKSKAGLRVYAALTREYFLKGRPTFRSFIFFASSLFGQGWVYATVQRFARSVRKNKPLPAKLPNQTAQA